MGLMCSVQAQVAAQSADADPGWWHRQLKEPDAVAHGATLPDPVRFGVKIEMGDIDLARQWLAAGLDPDFRADRIGTGLMIAAWEGNLPMADLFFHAGTSINTVNTAGEQALQLAAWKGNQEMVDWLLAHGAAINRQEKNAWSALHYAAFSGHKELVTDLLARGADINATSPNGSTPLMMAVYEGQSEIAKQLVEAGADRSIRNDRGANALDWAMKYERLQIARVIASPEEFAAVASRPKDSWGKVPVRSAAAPADLDQLLKARRYLVAKGISPERIDQNISALRAKYALEDLRQQREAGSETATTLEISASRAQPMQQSIRVVPAKSVGVTSGQRRSKY